MKQFREYLDNAEHMQEDTYAKVGFIMATAYAVSVIPVSIVATSANIIIISLLTIPLFTILLAGAIGKHGHKEESLAALTSITLSQIIFLAGLFLKDIYADFAVVAGFTAFLLVPWIIYGKIAIEYDLEEAGVTL